MTPSPNREKDLGFASILVASNNLIASKILQRILTGWRANVSIAKSQPELESKLNSHHYDLLIIDTQMPNVEAIRAVREVEDHGGDHIPIIMSMDDSANYYFDPQDDVTLLNKPYTSDTLFETVSGHRVKYALC